jgi:predicted secreted protein
MTITAALVLFSVTWFMVFFCVLPVRFKSQAQDGHVVPGTPRSAPSDPMLKPKAKITTLIAVVIFAVLYLVITSGRYGLADMDVFGLWANHNKP